MATMFQTHPSSRMALTLACALASGAVTQGEPVTPSLSLARIQSPKAPVVTEVDRVIHPGQVLTIGGSNYFQYAYQVVTFNVATLPQQKSTFTLTPENSTPIAMTLFVDGKEVGSTNSVGQPVELGALLPKGVATVQINPIPERKKVQAGVSPEEEDISVYTVHFALTVSTVRPVPSLNDASFPQRTAPVETPQAPMQHRTPFKNIFEGAVVPVTPENKPRGIVSPLNVTPSVPTDRHGNKYYNGGRVILGPGVSPGSVGGISVDGSSSLRIGTVHY